VTVCRLKTIERDVAAELPQRDRIVNAEKTTARRIDLVVTTNLTRLACSFIVVVSRAHGKQSSFTSFPRVTNERSTDASETHLLVRFENRSDEKTLEVVEAHVFITDASENNRARPPIEH